MDAERSSWNFVRIHTDEGVSGVGEASLEGKAQSMAACVADLSRRLVGQARSPRLPQDDEVVTVVVTDQSGAAGQIRARYVVGADGMHSVVREQAARRPVAMGVVAFTDRMTRMATLRSRPARAVRNTMLRIASRIPAVRRAFAFRLAELSTR